MLAARVLCRASRRLDATLLNRCPMAVRKMAIMVEADMLKNRVTHVSELENTDLFRMAKSGNIDAKREMMRREIMYVDGVSHMGTTATLLKISTLAEAGLGRVHASGKVMIFGAQAIGWGSIPLVFSLQASSAFNHYFVTAEPPEHGDADTWLEVGAWSWNWMEPPLGTISFVLLCLQWAAEQKKNIGLKTAAEVFSDRIEEKLIQEFPQYNSQILGDYVEAIALVGDSANVKDDALVLQALSQRK